MIGENLIAFNVKVEGQITQTSFKRHAIFLIDSEFLFEKYVCDDSDSGLVRIYSVDLSLNRAFKPIFHYLQNTQWSNIILDDRGITGL